MRRYDEPVDVRIRLDHVPDRMPEQFVWRGRLYLVREVLSCWVETGVWWRGPAAELVHGGGMPAQRTAETGAAGMDGAGMDGAGMDGAGMDGAGMDADTRPLRDGSADESTTWRVEASAGRLAGIGIFDLCERPPGIWRLVQALD